MQTGPTLLYMATLDSTFAAIPRATIRALDTLIRRVNGVREFTTDEWCLVRIAVVKCDQDITLSDGTRVTKGEMIGELHLWNEHIPPMPADGADFDWSVHFYSLIVRSLRALVHYMTTHHDLDNVHAWRGESSFIPKSGNVPELFARMGFDVVRQADSLQHMRRFTDFWENFYWWMLAWTFNPASLKRKSLLKLERWRIWISSARLREQYGNPRVRAL